MKKIILLATAILIFSASVVAFSAESEDALSRKGKKIELKLKHFQAEIESDMNLRYSSEYGLQPLSIVGDGEILGVQNNGSEWRLNFGEKGQSKINFVRFSKEPGESQFILGREINF